jgi:hypothetical protein
MIEKAALACLAASQHGNVQCLLLRENAAALEEVIERRDLIALA